MNIEQKILKILIEVRVKSSQQPRDIKNKNNIKILPCKSYTFIYLEIKDSNTEDAGRKFESFPGPLMISENSRLKVTL